jgi:ABC-type molybdenum transport system ATPase subunit/photorepair protein PhrA
VPPSVSGLQAKNQRYSNRSGKRSIRSRAGHVLEEVQEHELDQDEGIDVLVSVLAEELSDLGPHESEIDELSHAAQRNLAQSDAGAKRICVRALS